MINNCAFCNEFLNKCSFVKNIMDDEIGHLCDCQYQPVLIYNKKENNVVVWSIIINNNTVTLYSSKKENKTCLTNINSNEKLLTINHFIPFPKNTIELNTIIDYFSKLLLYCV